MLILKERYSFINFVVKSEFCPYLNIPFPQTHYSIIPTFQHSNCERSELSSPLHQSDYFNRLGVLGVHQI